MGKNDNEKFDELLREIGDDSSKEAIASKSLKLIHQGRTKTVYMTPIEGVLVLKYNNQEDGFKNIFINKYYFEKFRSAGIPSHCIDIDMNSEVMFVHLASLLGNGIDSTVHFFAMGDFASSYPEYFSEGRELNPIVIEETTKNSKAGNPRISREFLTNDNFGPIMTDEEMDETREMVLKAASIVQMDLAELGLTLVDIKFELGTVNGKIVIIDEVSASTMTVCNDIVCAKNVIPTEVLADILVTRQIPNELLVKKEEQRLKKRKK